MNLTKIEFTDHYKAENNFHLQDFKILFPADKFSPAFVEWDPVLS